MNFEWDENKNKTNLSKHGIDFSFARYVFLDEMAIDLYDQEKDNETRYKILGMIDINVFVVVYVERSGNKIRLISARKATSSERSVYYEQRNISRKI